MKKNGENVLPAPRLIFANAIRREKEINETCGEEKNKSCFLCRHDSLCIKSHGIYKKAPETNK